MGNLLWFKGQFPPTDFIQLFQGNITKIKQNDLYTKGICQNNKPLYFEQNGGLLLECEPVFQARKSHQRGGSWYSLGCQEKMEKNKEKKQCRRKKLLYVNAPGCFVMSHVHLNSSPSTRSTQLMCVRLPINAERPDF